MTPEQMKSVRDYLCARFNTDAIRLAPRKVQDSVEVYLDEEILGLLYVDDEDPNDVSYDLNISILQQDLDG